MAEVEGGVAVSPPSPAKPPTLFPYIQYYSFFTHKSFSFLVSFSTYLCHFSCHGLRSVENELGGGGKGDGGGGGGD